MSGADRVHYSIDPSASRFTVRAFSTGMLSALGHSPSFLARDLGGQLQFDPDAPESSSLRLTVNAASLSLTGNVSDKDRREIERVMQQEVLESSTYPEIIYQCPARSAVVSGNGGGPLDVTLQGSLTLHGVTRRQPVRARVFLMGEMLRSQGELTLRQGEYGIRPVSVAGGMLKVKDEVKLTFDIVARK